MTRTPQRLEKGLQVGLFALFLALPWLDTTLGLDPIEPPEREVLAELPPPPSGPLALREWRRGFESYFDDHFGWRASAVRHFHRLNYLLFRASETDEVVVGREGWLYYGGTAVDFQRANQPFSDWSLRQWLKTIEERQKWLDGRGIRYLLTVAPNKHTLYPEHLPAKLRRTGESTRWETLAPPLSRRVETALVDLHGPLLAAKRREQIYERTGSHWNSRGAYVAYSAIFERLNRWFPRLEHVPWQRVELAQGEPADLAIILGLEETLAETLLEPSGGVRYPRPELKRNGDLITTQDDPSLPRAVIFHDSFSEALIPYLAEHFSYAVFRWRASFDGDLVLRVEPDVVIEQRVERRLQLGAIRNTLPEKPAPGSR
jgi:hypothetical protein